MRLLSAGKMALSDMQPNLVKRFRGVRKRKYSYNWSRTPNYARLLGVNPTHRHLDHSDRAANQITYFLFQMAFFDWTNLEEHKWSHSGERLSKG